MGEDWRVDDQDGRRFGGVVLRSGFNVRLALIADLFIFVTAIMLFAVLPIFGDIDRNPLTNTEIVVALLGVPGLIGLVGRMLKRPHIPYNEWAYLYVGGYAGFMLMVFLTVGNDLAEWTAQVVISVMFLSGIVGSFGAHILDGSGSPLAPALHRRFASDDAGR